MHKAPTFASLRFFFFFGEDDSQTRTYDLSLLVDGTCHRTKDWVKSLFIKNELPDAWMVLINNMARKWLELP